MANFKLAKKDALSDTRTNIYDLHEKRLEYFESEKNKLNIYKLELKKLRLLYNTTDLSEKYNLDCKIEIINSKISSIENDTELNEYLLEFSSIVNEFDNSSFEDNSQKGIMDTFVNASINNSKTELYND
jgi:hypothetical protein